MADLADAEPSWLPSIERLRDAEHPVEVLVNNAGFGINQRFVGGDVDAEQSLIDVMVTAVMRLTHAAVPGMVERGRGAVINVSSIASFLPFGTYSAAKSWVTFFTQGLATELEGTGVRAVRDLPWIRPHRVPRAGRYRHRPVERHLVARGGRRGAAGDGGPAARKGDLSSRTLLQGAGCWRTPGPAGCAAPRRAASSVTDQRCAGRGVR